MLYFVKSTDVFVINFYKLKSTPFLTRSATSSVFTAFTILAQVSNSFKRLGSEKLLEKVYNVLISSGVKAALKGPA